MSAKVFISYRRDDSKYQARMIYAAFTQVVPRENVFMDIDSIPLGSDFRKILKDWVGQCDVLLALIGPGWINAVDPKTGHQRLKNPADFVHIEIAEALARDIRVVPVLLDGAPMPDVEALPHGLQELVYRHAEFVEYTRFDDDVARLIRKLQLDAMPGRELARSGAIMINVSPTGKSKTRAFVPGNGRTEWFRDHPKGPEMVVVPSGSFMMGSPEDKPQLFIGEWPQHKVTIERPFAVGRHAVTRGQFAAFVNDTNFRIDVGAVVWINGRWKRDPQASWRNPGFRQDDSHPVVCVNWDDTHAYAAWLSDQTGKKYRLLTEAEREYATRAGTTAPFWWGVSIKPDQANCDFGKVGEWRGSTVPVGSFAANPWGLYNVHGNVWEWCEDVWHDTYDGAPTDGAAWLHGGETGRHVIRGGSWVASSEATRSASREAANTRSHVIGFRLARTLSP